MARPTPPLATDVQHVDVDPLAPAAKTPTAYINRGPTPMAAVAGRGFTRNDVIEAFSQCFTQIGGMGRLAAWADRNPGDFYRLYSKMLPSSTVNISGNGITVIGHSIPRSPLDQVVDIDSTEVPNDE